MNSIIQHYYSITKGGSCASKEDLDASITEAIKKYREKNNVLSEKLNKIPNTTMSRYVKLIISIFDYNIHQKVSNKTASQLAAEFSLRLTISYLMVLLTTPL